MIACGHCGGRHHTVSEVRACSLNDDSSDRDPGDRVQNPTYTNTHGAGPGGRVQSERGQSNLHPYSESHDPGGRGQNNPHPHPNFRDSGDRDPSHRGTNNRDSAFRDVNQLPDAAPPPPRGTNNRDTAFRDPGPSDAGTVPRRNRSEPHAPARAKVGTGGPRPVPLTPDWQRLAGPCALGRNLVVNPGQTVPEPWAECERIVINGHPGETCRLRSLRKSRTRAVIELRTDPNFEPAVLNVPYWQLSPNINLEGESLQHLLFGHSVDARSPDAPTILAVSQAVAAGAVPLAYGHGDVDTAQGGAWCDGGPLEWFDDAELGAPVIPAVHLAIGSLATIGSAAPNADLAADQLRAVAHSGGGARIIAPAGSGKTRVLTERARHLIVDRGIDPAAICLLAFNVRAREEMQERTTDLAGLQIRTLNSLALAILRGSRPFLAPTGRHPPQVIDEAEVRRILGSLVKARRVAMADPLAVWIEALTATRLGLRSPNLVEQEFADEVRGLAEVVDQFRGHLFDARAVDFDEQIIGAIEVLCIDPAARAAARRACGVLLVDEFQDLTPAHILLIRLLAGPAANVFGVGDDDQTIYGYSGASPSWLIDFTDLFPGAAVHDLKVNYRCPPTVVDAAATLLTHNRRRIAKSIEARPGRPTLANEITVFAGDDPLADPLADTLADTLAHVSRLFDDGVPPQDIAVLARVNATLLGPMVLLAEDGIATTRPVGASFMDRTGVAGALAWLRAALAPTHRLDSASLETAVRRPPRGLSRRLAGWVVEQRSLRQLRALAGRLNQERDQLKVLEFTKQLERLRSLAADGATTVELLVSIRDDIGLGRALDNRLDASRRSIDRSTHGDDLAALLSVAQRCPDPAEFPDWLAQRLARRSALRTDVGPGRTDDSQATVTLSTIHRVKGREWPYVIVHDASEGSMPHRLSSDSEEERRVFHVAITRASESVALTTGPVPSRFISEMHTPAPPTPELVGPAARIADGRHHDPRAPANPNSPTDLNTRSDPRVHADTQTGRGFPVDTRHCSDPERERLRDELRTWRSTTARAAGVPAYVVFNDETLNQIVALRPCDDDELLTVSGIGPVKVKRYGESLIAIVNATAPNPKP